MCICGDGFYLRFLLSCFVSLALRASVAALLASSFELFDILTTHQFNYDSTRLVVCESCIVLLRILIQLCSLS